MYLVDFNERVSCLLGVFENGYTMALVKLILGWLLGSKFLFPSPGKVNVGVDPRTS